MIRTWSLTLTALATLTTTGCGTRYAGIITDSYTSSVTEPAASTAQPLGNTAQIAFVSKPGEASGGGTRTGALILGILPVFSILAPSVENNTSPAADSPHGTTSLVDMPVIKDEVATLLAKELNKAKVFSSAAAAPATGKDSSGTPAWTITGDYRFAESMRAHGSCFGILYWIGILPPLIGLPARTEGVSIDMDVVVTNATGTKVLTKSYHSEDSWQYGLYYGGNISTDYGQTLLPSIIRDIVTDLRAIH